MGFGDARAGVARRALGFGDDRLAFGDRRFGRLALGGRLDDSLRPAPEEPAPETATGLLLQGLLADVLVRLRRRLDTKATRCVADVLSLLGWLGGDGLRLGLRPRLGR